MEEYHKTIPSYNGDEPYIFLSYAHKDSKIVIEVVSWLKNNKYRVWYDEGIEFGSDWRTQLGNSIINCTQFLIFLSENSTASDFVTSELYMAMDSKKSILPIYLDNKELPPGIRFSIKKIQGIEKFKLEWNLFTRYLERGLLESCKQPIKDKDLDTGIIGKDVLDIDTARQSDSRNPESFEKLKNVQNMNTTMYNKTMPGLEKSAKLLYILGPEKSRDILSHLTKKEQEILLEQLAKIKFIDPEEKDLILEEHYYVGLAQKYVAEGDVSYATDILNKTIGTQKAQYIMNIISNNLPQK